MARQISETCQTRYTIELRKGIAWTKEFTYTTKDGVAIDLTGLPVSIKFKDVFPADLELFSDNGESVLGSSIEVTDAPAGKFIVKISKAETDTAAVGAGRWWIERYDALDVDKEYGHLLVLDDVNVQEI